MSIASIVKDLAFVSKTRELEKMSDTLSVRIGQGTQHEQDVMGEDVKTEYSYRWNWRRWSLGHFVLYLGGMGNASRASRQVMSE